MSQASFRASCALARYAELGSMGTDYGVYPNPDTFLRGLTFSPTPLPGVAFDMWLDGDGQLYDGLRGHLMATRELLARVPDGIIPLRRRFGPDAIFDWLWLLFNLDSPLGPDLRSARLTIQGDGDAISPLHLRAMHEASGVGKNLDHHVRLGLYTERGIPSGRLAPHFSITINDVAKASQRLLDWLAVKVEELPERDRALEKDLSRAADAFNHIPMATIAPRKVSDTSREEAKPVWDGFRLTLCGTLLKEYKRHPAWNQRRLLSAFQEAGWPELINSPWQEAEKLGETLRTINEAMPANTIKFHGVGNGQCRWRKE